jgi:hypothetical protein
MLKPSCESSGSVVHFHAKRVQQSAHGGATWLQVLSGRLTRWLGRALNRLGLPGAVRSMTLTDKLAGQHIAVSVGDLFVCVSVNGRDYYFDRITGRFDGTGSPLC